MIIFNNKTRIIILTCGLGLFFLSCATTNGYRYIDEAVEQQDFERGIALIESGQEGKNPTYPEKNAVSLYLDKGMLEHYAGNYADSSADLQEAERLIEEAFTKSVTAEIGSYIANDNTKEYPGEDFEDIYLNVFNALNYYNKGDLEGALVEIRKITWTNGKLDMLERKYEGAKTSAGEYVLEQLKELGLGINPQLPQGDSVNFSDSVLARYLGALFYLGNGNADSARIEFEKIKTAHVANPKVYNHPIPSAVTEAQSVPRGKARLNVIAFTGLSPIKEEGVFVSAFPFFKNKELWFPEFKLPKFVKRPSTINRIEVTVGTDTFNLELIEDMGAVAEETYNAHFGNLFFKTYIRVLLKYAAVDVAAIAAGKKGSSLAATAAAVAGKKTADATEGADIRMSRYLPDKAYVGGINLDPGVYTITINYFSGNKLVAHTNHTDVAVRANALNLVNSANLGGQSISQPSGGASVAATAQPAPTPAQPTQPTPVQPTPSQPAQLTPAPPPSTSTNDEWKEKKFYLGFGLSGNGFSASNIGGSYTGGAFLFGAVADLPLGKWFSITTLPSLGYAADNLSNTAFAVSMPLLLRVGGKPGRYEITGNIGYTVGNLGGFTWGATLGRNVGRIGILFFEADILTPALVSSDPGTMFKGHLGMKFGLGDK